MEAPPPDVEEKEDWLITYADAITLLMAFMVMLLTFAEYDIPAFEEAAAAIKSEIGNEQVTSPIQLMKLDIQDVVYDMEADQAVEVTTDGKGVVIELKSSAFYKPGSAEIREQAYPLLEKLALTLKGKGNKDDPKDFGRYVIEVEGHTDDDPIHTARFPSNWELSAGRAAGVVRFFIGQGIEPSRMMATGFAETIPKVANRDDEGKPIRENQSTNRRVLVRIYPMSLDKREEYDRKMEIKRQAQEAAATAAAAGAAGAATAGAAPVGAAPVGAAPVGAAPVGAAPVGAAPVGAAPAGAQPVPAVAPSGQPGLPPLPVPAQQPAPAQPEMPAAVPQRPQQG